MKNIAFLSLFLISFVGCNFETEVQEVLKPALPAISVKKPSLPLVELPIDVSVNPQEVKQQISGADVAKVAVPVVSSLTFLGLMYTFRDKIKALLGFGERNPPKTATTTTTTTTTTQKTQTQANIPQTQTTGQSNNSVPVTQNPPQITITNNPPPKTTTSTQTQTTSQSNSPVLVTQNPPKTTINTNNQTRPNSQNKPAVDQMEVSNLYSRYFSTSVEPDDNLVEEWGHLEDHKIEAIANYIKLNELGDGPARALKKGAKKNIRYFKAVLEFFKDYEIEVSSLDPAGTMGFVWSENPRGYYVKKTENSIFLILSGDQCGQLGTAGEVYTTLARFANIRIGGVMHHLFMFLGNRDDGFKTSYFVSLANNNPHCTPDVKNGVLNFITQLRNKKYPNTTSYVNWYE